MEEVEEEEGDATLPLVYFNFRGFFKDSARIGVELSRCFNGSFVVYWTVAGEDRCGIQFQCPGRSFSGLSVDCCEGSVLDSISIL